MFHMTMNAVSAGFLASFGALFWATVLIATSTKWCAFVMITIFALLSTLWSVFHMTMNAVSAGFLASFGALFWATVLIATSTKWCAFVMITIFALFSTHWWFTLVISITSLWSIGSFVV